MAYLQERNASQREVESHEDRIDNFSVASSKREEIARPNQLRVKRDGECGARSIATISDLTKDPN